MGLRSAWPSFPCLLLSGDPGCSPRAQDSGIRVQGGTAALGMRSLSQSRCPVHLQAALLSFLPPSTFLVPSSVPGLEMQKELAMAMPSRTCPPGWRWTGVLSAQVPGMRPLPSPLLQPGPPPAGLPPFPVPGPSAFSGCSQGAERLQNYNIKCSCTKTWPQSNYTRKQEEPLRLIWLFLPGLPLQHRRDTREGSCLGGQWCERGPVPHRVPWRGGWPQDCLALSPGDHGSGILVLQICALH